MGNVGASYVNQMAFVPPPPTYKKEQINMWLETERGSRLPAFHIRKGHKLTLLVSHANAEDLGIVLPFWMYMSEALQVDVFAYEYSGYGHSTGTPCEANLYADAKAALALLRDAFHLQPERDVVLYGKSIGSCPTCYLAGRNLVRGVIVVSGLASGARVLFPTKKIWLADSLYFNNLGHLSSNKSPVQLIHGTADEVVPFSNSQDLHAVCKANHPLSPGWIERANHNGLEMQHSDEFLRIVRGFLSHLLATPPATPKPPNGVGAWFSSVRSQAMTLWCGPGGMQPADGGSGRVDGGSGRVDGSSGRAEQAQRAARDVQAASASHELVL